MWRQGTIFHTFLIAASIWVLVVALALDEDGDKSRGKVQTTPKEYEEGNSVNDCTPSGADDDVASQVAESTKGECENNGPGFAPEAEYELILTTREALAEYGVHVSSEGGQIIHLAYRDRIAIPLVPQLLHDSKTEHHDKELIRSGFIRDRQEVVLVRSRSLEQAVVCGTCFRGGRYSVVRLKSTKTDDEGRQVYTFEKLIHPRWRPHALSFSIAADLVVIRGNRQPRVGSRILMTCVRSGDMPILFTDFLWSTPHLARYRPGPFKEEVTIQDVEAFAGSIPHTIVLKATLSSSKSSDRVVHHLTENSSFLFFGTVPAPSPSLSAFVLGSLKTDSRGTVERCDSAGPVFLSSSYWREIRNLAPTTHDLVIRRRKFCRWIAFGLTVAAALFGCLAFAGYARNTLDQMFAMREAGFRNKFSSWIRQRYGIDRHVVATFANSVDPHNVGLAAFSVLQNSRRPLTPGDPANDLRGGSIALLMRAIGASGLAAVAAVAATVLPFKLARKAHRLLKAKQLIRRGRQQVASSAQTTVDGMRDSERSNEQRKGFIFAVVS